MIELKVGDKCKAFNCETITLFTYTGKVTAIRGECICITFGTYSKWFHRKQCWKRVKTKKCDACYGIGKIGSTNSEGWKEDAIVCPKCNGRGKVRSE